MNILAISALILSCLPISAITGQSKTPHLIPRSDKILITGHSQYLGYLNASLNLSNNRSPLTGEKVYLDTLLLTDRGGGLYTGGTPYSYTPRVGNTIVIKLDRKSSGLFPPISTRDTVLGRYRIANVIEWISPLPDSVLAPGRIPRKTIRIRWNYTGTILNTNVRLTNFTTNSELFNRTLVAESVDVPAHLFIPGNRYRLDLEVVGPMGQFKMTDRCAPGSKIDFYYWGHIYFDVR